MEAPYCYRARDGAFYRDPVVVLPEGFLRMNGGMYELVLWADEDPVKAIGEVPRILARIRGHADPKIDWLGEVSMRGRPVPRSPIEHARYAFGIHFTIGRRFPVPSFHDGCERYASRLKGCVITDWASTPRDAYELRITE